MPSSPEVIRLSAPLRRVSLLREEIAAAARADEIEAVRRRAYHQGFEEASTFLNEQMAEQRGEVIQLQEQTFKAIADENSAHIAKLCSLLPDLAIEIARRVLAGLEPDRARVERTIAELLGEMAPGTRDIEISLHPADLEMLGKFDAGFRDKYPGLQFVGDDALHIGDCKMRSCFGLVDARLETKLENLSRSLR
jgi:flagellar assembly protein FliH